MNKRQAVQKTAKLVKDKFSGEGTGHDWWHMYRVWQTAKTIAKKEGGDMFTVELGALLHDIEDWKFNDGDSSKGARVAREWLKSLGVNEKTIDEVAFTVEHISFKGGVDSTPMRTLEGKIVQDADRLDALGAIGIARTFAYGGSAGREIYNPDVAPKEYSSLEDFKKQITQNHTINHFYEKLLLLKEQMNTKTGRDMARARHNYMEKFLQEFYAEWEGKI